ncbi:MAG TPA: hypothetical protein VJZ71_16315 [Phycisphaerae bacterium]|nr:hypothetical protein [Phycisphaerae bacterium]
MRRYPLSIPELAIISGTRAALGAGLGLLLGDRIVADKRRAAGWSLFLVGAASTVPILVQLFRSRPLIAGSSSRNVGRRTRRVGRRSRRLAGAHHGNHALRKRMGALNHARH